MTALRKADTTRAKRTGDAYVPKEARKLKETMDESTRITDEYRAGKLTIDQWAEQMSDLRNRHRTLMDRLFGY